MDLSGRVAIVTGAGRGLGRAYAEALATAGAAVVVNDADGDAAREVADKLAATGRAAVAEPGAVGAAPVAEALVHRAVATYGRLDVLVANAGILRDRIVWKMADEDFDAVVGPEYVRGGKQLCILNKGGFPTRLSARIRALFRPRMAQGGFTVKPMLSNWPRAIGGFLVVTGIGLLIAFVAQK